MDKKTQGKKNRVAGARFELSVRKDLEKSGWIVSKWQNNVEFDRIIDESEKKGKGILIKKMHIQGRLIPTKRKFNPFKKALGLGTGFPDFIALTRTDSNATWPIQNEDGTFGLSGVRCWIGVEAKLNGYLDKEEKLKCKWLLENNIFSKILIARKGEKRGEIIYDEFK